MKKLSILSDCESNNINQTVTEIPLNRDTQYIIYGGQFSQGIGSVLEQMIDNQIKGSALMHKKDFRVISSENGQTIIDIYEKMLALGNPPKYVLVASRYQDNFNSLKLCQHIDAARRINQHPTKIFSHSISSDFNRQAESCGVVDERVDKSNLDKLSYQLMLGLVLDGLKK